jgi:hypothetical protein
VEVNAINGTNHSRQSKETLEVIHVLSILRPLGNDSSCQNSLLTALTNSRTTLQTVVFPIVKNSEYISRLAPYISLNNAHATLTGTGIALRYLVFCFSHCGRNIDANQKTAALDMRKH